LEEEAGKTNKIIYENQRVEDSIRELANINMDTAIAAVDKFINENQNNSHYYNLKGDIYFKYKLYSLSIIQYSNSLRLNPSPKYLDSRARAFVKLNKLDSALSDLKISSSINNDGYWYIGNLFEIEHQIDSAKFYYLALYAHDTAAYAYCRDRVYQLSQLKTPELFKELYWIDQSKGRHIIMF